MTHPSHRVEKEYQVRVSGDLEQALPLLRRPMVVDGENMTADWVEQMAPDWLTVVIHQGKTARCGGCVPPSVSVCSGSSGCVKVLSVWAICRLEGGECSQIRKSTG